MIGIGLLALVLALAAGGFYLWSREQTPVGGGAPDEPRARESSISLLTEAVAYVGAVLVVAGGGAAIAQRWSGLSSWAQVAILAGTAAFFLGVGVVLRRVRDGAVQRLVGVVWFLSVVGLAAAVGVAAHEVYGASGEVTTLAMGLATTAYASVLWLIRTRELQVLALFAGSLLTLVGAVIVLPGDPTSVAVVLPLWVFGLVWTVVAWQRHLEPVWVSAPLGAVLTLLAPAFAVGQYGWVYAIGIGTAATAMALSVKLRKTPLLALGTVAMFGYATSFVVRYFSDSLGVPATLAITGVVVLVLATVSTRLGRTTHPGDGDGPARKGPRHPHGVKHA